MGLGDDSRQIHSVPRAAAVPFELFPEYSEAALRTVREMLEVQSQHETVLDVLHRREVAVMMRVLANYFDLMAQIRSVDHHQLDIDR